MPPTSLLPVCLTASTQAQLYRIQSVFSPLKHGHSNHIGGTSKVSQTTHPTTKSHSLRCVYKSTHFTPVVGPSIHHPILENFDRALLPAEAGLLQGSGLNAGSTVHAGKGRAPFFVESCGNHPEDTLETEPITVGGFQTSSLNNHIPTSH